MRTLLCAGLLWLALPVYAAEDEETQAKALVDRWLKDQNTANFDDYQTLYAQRFFGIRRSGPREVRFDRAGWMKDRRRMFNPKRPATVAVEDFEFHPSPTGGEVKFTRRFQQGSYRDVGTKVLLLRREAAGLRIADERLLDSDLEGTTVVRDAGAWSSALGIVSREGIVLSLKPDANWAASNKPRTRVGRDGRQVTEWKLRDDRIPAATRALVNSPVELITDKGQTCSAKIKRLRMVAVVAIDTMAAEAGGKPEPIDYEWSGNPEGMRVVAEIEGGCKNALLARAAGSTAKIAVAKKADATTEKRALAAARALPLYRSIGDQAPPVKGNWDTSIPSVKTLDVEVEGKPQRWVSVGLSAENGCVETPRELWALFLVDGERLTLINNPGIEAIDPDLTLDLDGDGRPEIVFKTGGEVNLGYDLEGGVVRRKGNRFETIEKVRNRYLGCPC
jgi:hypothetical protein